MPPVFVRAGEVVETGALCEDGFILLGRLSHLRRNTDSPIDFFRLDVDPRIIVPEYTEQ